MTGSFPVLACSMVAVDIVISPSPVEKGATGRDDDEAAFFSLEFLSVSGSLLG
jgi:hypothetical protein